MPRSVISSSSGNNGAGFFDQKTITLHFSNEIYCRWFLLKGLTHAQYPARSLCMSHAEWKAGISVARLAEMTRGASPWTLPLGVVIVVFWCMLCSVDQVNVCTEVAVGKHGHPLHGYVVGPAWNVIAVPGAGGICALTSGVCFP